MKTYLILILLLACHYSFAQHPYFINYTDRDGLPTNEIYSIIQSSAGDLWIGTELGLVRYDGLKFHEYFNEDALNKSISGIFEDAEGQIWCNNFANQFFYIKEDSLHLLESWDPVQYKNNRILNLSQGSSPQELIISTDRSLFVLDKAQDKHVHLLLPKYSNYLLNKKGRTFVFSNFWGIQELSHQADSLVVRSLDCPTCLFFKDLSSSKIQRYPHTALFESSSGESYSIIQKYDNIKKRDYFNNKQELINPQVPLPFLYKIKDSSISPIYFPEEIAAYQGNLTFSAFKFEQDSILWLATNHGLFRWNMNTNKINHYFQNLYCSAFIIDNEGSVWVSTLENGLFYLPDLGIESFSLKEENTKSRKLAIDNKNRLFVGLGNGQIEVYQLSETVEYLRSVSLSNNSSVSALKLDTTSNTLWIGSGRATQKLNLQDFSLEVYPMISAVKDFAFGDSFNIAVALGHGAGVYNNNSNKNTLFTQNWKQHYKFNPKSQFLYLRTCCPRSYSILWKEGQAAEIWVGFYDNLYRLVEDSAYIIKMPNGKSITAMDLVEDKEGNIWVGSANQGLLKIVDNKVALQITKGDGLPDVYITKLLTEGDLIWLATPKGIVKYIPAKNDIIIYDKYYGVPNIKITDMLLHKNRLYFTGDQQLMSLDTRINPTAIPAPIIRLDGLWVNDKLQKLGKQELQLQPNENNLRIELSAITFRSQSAYQFKYRLKNLEENWITVSSFNNSIRYPSLAPGEYIFEAYTINKWGAESKKPIQLYLHIAYPFYQKWWFILFAVILVAGLISGFFWWQLKRIQKRNQERLERSQLEKDLRISQLTALKAQMNPHFVFNVLNSIQGLYALKNTKEANKQLSRFARMVRLTLHYSNELSIPLSKELELLSLYLDIEKSRFSDSLQIDIQIDEDLDIEAIKIPSLLIQPYVENAIKHGLLHKKGEKKLRMEVKWEVEDEILLVKIEDNGIGRQAAMLHSQKRKDHQSFASSANAKRLQLLNQERQVNSKIGIKFIDKVDENHQATGTIVYIYIPL